MKKPKTPSPKKRKHSSEEEEEDSEDDENKRLCYDENDEGFLRCDDIIVPPPPRPPGTIDALGPRMIILKIVNTNFKSYHNVQTLGPFHKNFNAIVGPNGSGKSNVIDSLLFVFGYRASKIRSRKLAVLIHDSKIYPNITSCTVAIHFILIKDKDNDPDGYDVIPDSELVVARTAHKDNSSFYQVNGKKVQYKEVAKLLREHGVDLDHNRFLILQGEVEQISLMKPKGLHPSETGMLEYLEDIVGTTRLKEPLDKAELKIDFLTELRNEKQNRVKMAEREKADLEEPMKEAVEFLKFENDLIKKKNKVFQRQLLQYESKIEENTDKKRVLTEKEDEFKEKLKTIGDEKKQREIDYKEHAIKYEKLNKQKEQLTESFDKANTKDINLQAEMVQINKRRKKVIELVKEETAKIEKNEKIPEKNQETIAEYQERAQQLTVQQEQLEAEKTELLSSLRDETGELLEQKELLQNQLTGLRKVVDQTKSTYNVAENELKIYQSAEVKPKEKLEKIKLTFENSKQKILCHTKNIKDLKQKIPEMEQQLKDTIDELGQNKIQEAKLMQEIKINRVSIEEFRSSQLASRSKGRILDFLTRQKDEGKLSGLFGRLGDLGAINQKYDVAVSTACGALDNIVADSVDTAQKSIQMLKTHNVGRATFIALEKQEHLRKQANSKINTPENVHRLFDLVTVEDDRVRTAFYYALRNTLVANDIEQATRIAYGPVRYRVVSLKGDLIETSGTMSGGGKQVSRGRMGQCVAVQSTSAAPSPKKKVEDMESALTKLEDKVRALHEQQQVLDQEVNTLQPELNRMKIDLEKFTMELQSLQKAQPSLAEQLKTQEKIVQAATINPAEVKKLETKVAATKTEYEKATSKSENIQKQVDVIVKQIDSKTQKKMKGVNSKLSECTEKLEKFKTELSKLKLAIKTAERVVKQSKEKITNFEQEKLECESKLKKNQAIRKEIETEAAGLLEEIEKIKEQMEEGESMFGEEKQKIAELTQKLNQTKSEKIELDQKLNEVNEALDGYVETKKRIEQKLSQLKFHEIPDEEVEKLEKFPEDILMSFDMKQLENEVRREEEQLKASTPNLTAIEAYRKKHEAYIQRVQDLEEIVSKRTKIREFRDNLRKMRQTEFRAGFNIISVKIKEMYQLITLGGDAELEFVDSYDPFTEGIVLNVRPPKKSWKNIINLSGGEKTLSSLALVFALHYFKPSPLYFMDEIDAALDFKNVSIVGNYIKERTKNAQFIIISLRSNMFELADHLIGIYKTNDMTQSITICPKKLVVVRQNIINSQPLTQNGGYPSLSQPLVLNGDVISNEESNDSFTHSIHPEDEARDPPSQLEGTDAGMECA